MSDEPEPLKNGNYRFSFAVPKNIHEGKAQISIKAAYDNGKAYESRRQALIYSPEALITQTTDFENLKLKSGDLIERTSDIIPELSDISAALYIQKKMFRGICPEKSNIPFQNL